MTSDLKLSMTDGIDNVLGGSASRVGRRSCYTIADSEHTHRPKLFGKAWFGSSVTSDLKVSMTSEFDNILRGLTSRF